MVFLYNIFIFLFRTGIYVTAFWNTKAKQWLQGRKKIWQELEEKVSKDTPLVWIHASSAGEFEQAKPLIEKLKLNYPSHKILVTLFSPSGYSIAKTYTAADYCFFLPLDTARNAKRFIKLIDPRLVIFVKYDFWFHYLSTLHKMQIPLLLISAVFKKDQSFFKWYGGFYKKMLFYFTQIFVQDEVSLDLLQQNGNTNSRISGDTRFDRVIEVAKNFKEIPFIKEFTANSKVIVAGSTWPDDENLLKKSFTALHNLKLILAPHEIHEQRIQQIQKEFSDSILYSKLKEEPIGFVNKKVLIIDNIGLLSRLYKYATITYIGGGFTRDGIHNCLEAATYGKPVVFGSNYVKYREAKELVKTGGAFSIANSEEFMALTQYLLMNEKNCENAGSNAEVYVTRNAGATQRIMNYIQEKRLLTN